MDRAEPDHARFLGVVNSAPKVYVTPLVVAETHFILSSGGERDAAAAFLTAVSDGLFQLANPTRADYGRANALVAQYQGTMGRKRRKPGSLDLADAMNVVVAAQLGTNLILATDQDYRAVRPLSRHTAFKLLPWDDM
jgi:predicted nucleic acid-binding protein